LSSITAAISAATASGIGSAKVMTITAVLRPHDLRPHTSRLLAGGMRLVQPAAGRPMTRVSRGGVAVRAVDLQLGRLLTADLGPQ
jgi:hypothetical protein